MKKAIRKVTYKLKPSVSQEESLMNFTGKVGLITGVANHRSLSWAIAQSTAKAGASLILTYQGRFQEHVTELADTLSPKATVLPLDVTKDEEMAQVFARIDRKRKLPVTSLLYALGLNSEEILNHFYNTVTFVRGPGGWQIPFQPENWRGAKPAFDIIDAKTGEVVFPAGQKISPRAANKAQKDGLETLLIPTEEIFNRYSAFDLINESTGEIYIEAGDEVSAENLEKL